MFEKIKGTLDKGVAAVSVKSEALVETSRTKTALNSARQRMAAEFGALGQTVYSLWRSGQDITAITEELERIQDIENEIAELEKRLEQIKEEESRILNAPQAAPVSSGRFCSNCGKPLASGSRFCGECGTPVP